VKQKINHCEDNLTGKPKEPSRHTEWMLAQSFHARISNLIAAAVNMEKRVSPRARLADVAQ
jgi:hypothetical protein